MWKENNLADRATKKHVQNTEHICTMSFAAKQQPILRFWQRGEHTPVNRSLRNPDVLARTKRHKEKHRIPVKDMINRYREMQMKKARLIKQRTEYIFIIWQTHGLERFHLIFASNSSKDQILRALLN